MTRDDPEDNWGIASDLFSLVDRFHLGNRRRKWPFNTIEYTLLLINNDS